MKAQTLEAGQFVESMLTSERNGKWNEKDVTKEIYNILNEDMIFAVDLAILAAGHRLTHKPQKINHTSKTGRKNNVEECFRCSLWPLI